MVLVCCLVPFLLNAFSEFSAESYHTNLTENSVSSVLTVIICVHLAESNQKIMSLKDIDTFLQQFVQKCIQVIVQSRLGGSERTQTKCNPEGKDWFNLDIQDIKDIVDQTAKCLKSISAGQSLNQSLYFLKNNWNICCEISLKNSEGLSLVLEYWILSAKTLSSPEVPDGK